MRFVFLAIVLVFPIADLYVTARLARWSGIPLWIWLAGSFLAGALLLRNERTAFRTRTVAALHGEQSLLRGLVDSGRKVVGFDLVEVAPDPTGVSEWDGNVAARVLYKMIGFALMSNRGFPRAA